MTSTVRHCMNFVRKVELIYAIGHKHVFTFLSNKTTQIYLIFIVIKNKKLKLEFEDDNDNNYACFIIIINIIIFLIKGYAIQLSKISKFNIFLFQSL